jgi:hypothetical protein
MRLGDRFIVLVFAVTACGEKSPSPDDQTTAAPAASYGSFAYVGSSRSLALALTSIPDSNSVPAAICASGGPHPVTFTRRQRASSADNGRHVASNFPNQAGDVFRIHGTTTENETCFLMKESGLGDAQPLALQRATSAPSCKARTRDRLQSARTRAVVECWTLATAPQQRSNDWRSSTCRPN